MTNEAKQVNISLSPEQMLDLALMVRKYIEDLPERTEDILVKRYGLDGSKKKTLEEIGKAYGITRERVRQIESASLRDIKKSEKADLLNAVEEFIEGLIRDRGKLMQHSHLVDTAVEQLPGDVEKNHVEFVLHVSDKFNLHKENDHFEKSWYLSDADLKLPKKVVNVFIGSLEEQNEPMDESQAIDHIMKNDSVPEVGETIGDEDRIRSYLHVGKKIQRNPFGEWGLAHWNEIKPRGVKDKAYVVLKKEGKPLHFTDITSKINDSGFGKRKAIPQTVHNELIKDDRFVLVGRGIYALTTWGFREGTVADIVLDVLKKADQPMTRDEIVEEVMKQRLVKKNTIILALQNRNLIQRDGEKFIVIEAS